MDTKGQLQLRKAADLANVDVDERYRLNPGLHHGAIDPKGPQRLLLPKDAVDRFTRQLASLPADQRAPAGKKYEVAKGDTLASIARKFNVDASAIGKANQLDGALLRPGQSLLIPSSETTVADNAPASIDTRTPFGATQVFHTVQAGENLRRVAQQYQVSVNDIQRWNGLGPNDPIKLGQKLNIWSGRADLAATSQPWKIAYFHRPPYSSGSEHGSDLTVRAAFGPIFERYGVQLVLSGHDHDYERTLPQDGVTYVVSGGGGAFLYSVAKSSFTAYAAARHHYVHVDVDSCTLELRAIGLDGSTFDSETLSRCASPPPADGDDVVLYASEAPVRKGLWQIESDPAAAGGQRLRHPDRGAPKLQTPLASPSNYFEMTFTAEAGIPYRLWIRGKAQRDYWGNDSVFVQFDGSVTKSGSSQFRIGTTSATTYNLEECSGCGLSAWGWEDNGWGRGVLGPQIYFARSGTQRVRVQTREDGLVIDQIVLSPDRYLTTSPGSLKNDTTILQR